MSKAWFEFKMALRSLARSPGYALVAMVMFALGIGLTAYMFGAVKGYLLGSLPFPESDRIVHVSADSRPGWSDMPPRVFEAWTRDQTAFSAMGGFTIGTVNLSGDDRPERYSGGIVTGALFDVLAVAPTMGRTLTANDSRVGAPMVVVIGDELWRHRFNEDPAVIGQRIRVNGRDAEVVGVMPAGFRFPNDEVVWVPQQQDLADLTIDGGFWSTVVGRLRDGVEPAQARGELQALYSAMLADEPNTTLEPTLHMRSLFDAYITDEPRMIILTLFISVVLVLMIACSNVANLTFARVASRRREFAVRSSLGAGRARIIGTVIAEVMFVAVAGAVIGLYLAEWVGVFTDELLASSQESPPYWVDSSLDWRTAAFTAAAAALSALGAGLIPAWHATRGDITTGLRDGGHGSSDLRSGKLSRALVVVQVVLCCVLLVSAGLMTRSALNATVAPDGLGERNAITGRIGLFESTHPDAAARMRTYERLQSALAALPGVHSAALTTSLPLTGGPTRRYRDSSTEVVTLQDAPSARWSAVTPGYFHTFGVGVVRGRDFSIADGPDAAPVVIVNAAFAAREWPGADPVGRRIQLQLPDGPWLTVVGVVPDFAQGADEQFNGVRPALFVPLAQDTARFVSFAAAVSGDPGTYANPVREAMLRVDADTPIYWLRSFAEVTALTTFMSRFLASLFSVFAAIALMLAAAGLYAVLASAVTARTREIGIRRALGADDRGVVGMILGDGARQCLLGIAIGAVLAVGFAQLLSRLLVGVGAFDPVTFVAVITMLLAVCGLASWLPARRALRIQPMVALRQD